MTQATLAGFAAIAVVAGAVATVVAVGGGAQAAGAAPKIAQSGALGIGTEVVAPVSTPVSAEGKVPVAGAAATTAALASVVQRKDAPVPAKKRAVAKSASRRSSGSSSSRSGSGSGWRSARVSWYGPGFYGNTMAGGGTLQRDSMVVAHRSLPFGTRVQFEYGGRTCTAVVMDRGPYVGGRTFDLGPGTARALGFSGVGTVRYRVLGR